MCMSTYRSLRACVLPARTCKSAHMCALLHVLVRLHVRVFACGPACAFVQSCRFVCVFACVHACFVVSWGENKHVILCEILGIILWERVDKRHHGFTLFWQLRNYDIFH